MNNSRLRAHFEAQKRRERNSLFTLFQLTIHRQYHRCISIFYHSIFILFLPLNPEIIVSSNCLMLSAVFSSRNSIFFRNPNLSTLCSFSWMIQPRSQTFCGAKNRTQRENLLGKSGGRLIPRQSQWNWEWKWNGGNGTEGQRESDEKDKDRG